MDRGLESIKGQGLFSKNTGEPVRLNLGRESQIGRPRCVGEDLAGRNSGRAAAATAGLGQPRRSSHKTAYGPLLSKERARGCVSRAHKLDGDLGDGREGVGVAGCS